MHSRIDEDPHGREYLTYEGSGWITSVNPTDPSSSAYRVEILCRRPSSVSGSLRTFVTATIPAQHDLLDEVLLHEATGSEVEWLMQWHRHDHVPAEIPVTSLDLSTDGVGHLHDLRPLPSNPPIL